LSRIIICRHGNTFDNGDKVTRVGARTDLPLSSSGILQSKNLKEYFHSNNYNFKKAYCSVLARTQQTAQIILEGEHGVKSPKILNFLKEVDYGPDENKNEEQVIGRIGREALKSWDQHAIVPDGWNISPKKIISSWRSFLELQTENSDILVVTSNGIARFLLQSLAFSPEVRDIKLKTGAFGLLTKTTVGFSIAKWNQRP
jgi:broad specificity phosphatase PhoE